MKNITAHAITALVFLSQETGGKNKGKTITIPEVADEVGVSSDYMDQILRQLKAAGLVGSKRGCTGGIFLNRANDSEISVYDVYRIFERNENKSKLFDDFEKVMSSALSISLKEFSQIINAKLK